MRWVVIAGAIRFAKLQSRRHHQQTNSQHFTDQTPFLSSNQQCRSTWVEASKVKVKRLFVVNHHRRSAQVWHVFWRDLTVLPAHPHVHPQSEWAIPAFAFPAIIGTHLPTPEGWKAEKTWVRSSTGRDSNPQPPDCKSGTLPHSH